MSWRLSWLLAEGKWHMCVCSFLFTFLSSFSLPPLLLPSLLTFPISTTFPSSLPLPPLFLFFRFCTVTCCKRYSAEKRYYPYGRDEEGVAMSIRQGLVNRHRTLRPNSSKPRKVFPSLPCLRLPITTVTCIVPFLVRSATTTICSEGREKTTSGVLRKWWLHP